VVDLLRSSVREADVVFRSGGDEFVILLPFADLEAGRCVRERILVGAGESALLGRLGKATMTIVVGEYEVGEGKEVFMARVVEALSWAKRNDDDGLRGVRVPVM